MTYLQGKITRQDARDIAKGVRAMGLVLTALLASGVMAVIIVASAALLAQAGHDSEHHGAGATAVAGQCPDGTTLRIGTPCQP